MKILHYALGFPPYRTGGLTKYCTDLMLTQREQGHQVALMWPGQMGLINKSLKIKRRKSWNKILNFEIINPLPIALDEGILDTDMYTKSVDKKAYALFLRNYVPDVIHIHTLMGLHREFIDVANSLNICIVFTSHDYYGLCPKVSMFCNGKSCDDNHGCEGCFVCNQSALSINKIILMQSPLYRMLKNTTVVKKLRKKHRREFFEQEIPREKEVIYGVDSQANRYSNLRMYYIEMLDRMNIVHFNSTIAEKIYGRYFSPKHSEVISITHKEIKDNRKCKKFDQENIRFTYLGPPKPFKGFQFMLQVLDELWEQGVQNFELHIYSTTGEQRPYITHCQEGYPYSQLKEIFDNTDLLIVPSLWYETFGFTVLEALSYGVPVLVSENVGAKDILGVQEYGAIVPIKKEAFKNSLRRICMEKELLFEYNRKIVESFVFKDMERHSLEIMNLYKREK